MAAAGGGGVGGRGRQLHRERHRSVGVNMSHAQPYLDVIYRKQEVDPAPVLLLISRRVHASLVSCGSSSASGLAGARISLILFCRCFRRATKAVGSCDLPCSCNEKTRLPKNARRGQVRLTVWHQPRHVAVTRADPRRPFCEGWW